MQTHQPTFICEDKDHDLFTYENANQGTKSLAYPIGLTTVDEQVYAGGCIDVNENYYLYNGQENWTMSPALFFGESAFVFFVGNLVQPFSVDNESHLRPVLNLKSDALKFGDGTSGNPFRTVE